VIDDDPSGTQLLLTLLGLEGFLGTRLENWADPIGDLKRIRPDLVLMDVYLSELDGIKLLREMRAHPDPRVASVPVLMMSAEDLEEQCLSAGADGFFEKPFELDILLGMIKKIMEGSTLEN